MSFSKIKESNLKSLLKKTILLLCFFSFLFILPEINKAAPTAEEGTGLVGCSGTNCDACKLIAMVQRILNWVIGMAFLFGTGLAVYGGLVMIVTGAAKGIDTGRNILKWAIIGLVVILLSWLIISLIIVNLVAEEARGTGGVFPNQWFKIDCDKINEVLVPVGDTKKGTSSGTSGEWEEEDDNYLQSGETCGSAEYPIEDEQAVESQCEGKCQDGYSCRLIIVRSYWCKCRIYQETYTAICGTGETEDEAKQVCLKSDKCASADARTYGCGEYSLSKNVYNCTCN